MKVVEVEKMVLKANAPLDSDEEGDLESTLQEKTFQEAKDQTRQIIC